MNFNLTTEEEKLLRLVQLFAKKEKQEVYLVGGFLRDIFLKRRKINPDIDFSIPKNSINFGRKLSRQLKCGFVVLDKEHGCCRLVKKMPPHIYTLDFADFRGKNIKDDLSLRDFTINSLALGLDAFLGRSFSQKEIIDPSGGQKDLGEKLIRITGKSSFDDDPLRILRAFSLSATFSFKIDKITLQLAKSKRNKLNEISSERVRDELFKILEAKDPYSYFLLLDKLKILEVIFPEIKVMRGVYQGPYHHLDIFKHSLETLRQQEIVLDEFRKNTDVSGYLNEELSYQRKRSSLLKLGAFLHDIGKPRAKRRREGKLIFHGHERLGADISEIIARRLKLSNQELDALEKMVFWHLRPGYLADSENPSPRAKFRYFRDAGDEAASILLLSLADQRSTRGPLTTPESRQQHERVVHRLIREYFRKLKTKKLARLIDGNDLLNNFKLKPSPLIGEILKEIEELQAIGKVKTKQEALVAASRFIKK